MPAGLLVQEVWDGDPPADTPGALQSPGRAAAPDARRGRRRLGRRRLPARPPPPDDVDLHRFDRLAGEGTRAPGRRRPRAGRPVVLDDALTLWRGPALADLPDRAAGGGPLGDAAPWTSCAPATPPPSTSDQAEHSPAQLTALCGGRPLDPGPSRPCGCARPARHRPHRRGRWPPTRPYADSSRTGSAFDPGPELHRALPHGELLNPAAPATPTERA
ncbi:hypothetical protein LV779_19470 [Streptomyces thinghirensis]|nr:hypothetical protein [Streptomyces thinghirensis]